MIFITLGSQKFQFNRLLKEIDRLIDEEIIKEEVFAQIGYSDYLPRNYEYRQFMDRDKFNDYIDHSDLVITHGGTGAIMGAIKKGKKVIAIPRLSKYGEHVDDHQLQIINEFEQMNLIIPCLNMEELGELYERRNQYILEEYHSHKENILNSIEGYLDTLK